MTPEELEALFVKYMVNILHNEGTLYIKYFWDGPELSQAEKGMLDELETKAIDAANNEMSQPWRYQYDKEESK